MSIRIMKDLYLKIADTDIKLSTNDDAYFKYLEEYYSAVLQKSSKSHVIDIIVERSENTIDSFVQKTISEDSYVRVGGNTYVGEDQLVTVRKIKRKWKAAFVCNEKNDQLQLTVRLNKNSAKDFWYSLSNDKQYEYFNDITFHALYYPLMWFQEYHNKTYPLHASAVEVNNKGIVLCGMEGMGKSTMTLKFLQDDNARFISDNLIFCTTDVILPCFELLRIKKGEHCGQLEEIKDNALKGYYKPKEVKSDITMAPSVLIFPEFSDEHYAREISIEDAVNRAVTLSYVPDELSEYFGTRNIYNQLNLDYHSFETMYNVLNSCFQSAQCLCVGLKKDNDIDANYHYLKEVIWGVS